MRSARGLPCSVLPCLVQARKGAAFPAECGKHGRRRYGLIGSAVKWFALCCALFIKRTYAAVPGPDFGLCLCVSIQHQRMCVCLCYAYTQSMFFLSDPIALDSLSKPKCMPPWVHTYTGLKTDWARLIRTRVRRTSGYRARVRGSRGVL